MAANTTAAQKVLAIPELATRILECIDDGRALLTLRQINDTFNTAFTDSSFLRIRSFFSPANDSAQDLEYPSKMNPILAANSDDNAFYALHGSPSPNEIHWSITMLAKHSYIQGAVEVQLRKFAPSKLGRKNRTTTTGTMYSPGSWRDALLGAAGVKVMFVAGICEKHGTSIAATEDFICGGTFKDGITLGDAIDWLELMNMDEEEARRSDSIQQIACHQKRDKTRGIRAKEAEEKQKKKDQEHQMKWKPGTSFTIRWHEQQAVFGGGFNSSKCQEKK